MKPRLKLTLDGRLLVIRPSCEGSRQCESAPERSANDFLSELEAANVTVAQWCRDNRLASGVVWAVIRGAVLGRSGEARRAMQLMKLPLPSAKRSRLPAATVPSQSAADGLRVDGALQ